MQVKIVRDTFRFYQGTGTKINTDQIVSTQFIGIMSGYDIHTERRIAVLWDMTPISLIKSQTYRRFGGR